MIRIRVTCSYCHVEIELDVDDVRLLVVGTLDHFTDAAYRFRCTGCERMVTRTAVPYVVEMLADYGCRVDESGDVTHVRWVLTRWVARLDCGHDAAGRSGVPPSPGDGWACDMCQTTGELVDVIEGRKVAA